MARTSKGIGLKSTEACAPPRATREQVEQERRWRAESDLRTLREAEQIRSDRSRVAMAKKIAAEEMRALSKVAGKRK